ncbi:MAG: hypothetical protein IKO03_05775 [Lachnospiraceae bacterium]|nr:hypothetical protein [Lachnospiraceae bacterium]
MYKVDNIEIGEYIGGLIIAREYASDRRFAKEYIKLRDGKSDEPDPAEIQRVANKVCQIKKGEKGIQITDLPLFSDLLEVSIEAILSAGEFVKPVSTRMTNYTVACLKNEDTWKKYIDLPDKLILNEDEYGKNIIDYALEFKNYDLLKFLTDNDYIYFVDDDQQKYWGSFGAGTRIERRHPGSYDDLDVRMKERDDLRTGMIALALERGDYDMLDKMKAREIPSLYEGSYFYRQSIDFEKYYNPKMMDAILKSSDEVLKYFSKEFEVNTNFKAKSRFMFPYLGKLIEMTIKKNGKAAMSMLKRALKHNKDLLKRIKQIAELSAKSIGDKAKYMPKDAIYDWIMHDYIYYDDNDTVAYWTQDEKGAYQGVFSNVIRVSGTSKDPSVAKLIGELNESYRMIHDYKYEGEV